jgi:hypothetical protein
MSANVRAAALLAAGCSSEATARKVGVSPKTIQRWRRDDDFNNLIDSLRQRMTDTALGLLTAGAAAAVRTLRRNIKPGVGSPATQNGAANSILDRLLKVKELIELERRVTQLEVATNKGTAP